MPSGDLEPGDKGTRMAEPNHVLCWLRVQGIGARLERKTGRTQARVLFVSFVRAEIGLPPSRSAPRLLLLLIHLQRFRTLTPEKAKQTEELARLVRLRQLANILIYTFYGSHLYIVVHIAIAVYLSQKPNTRRVKMCAINISSLDELSSTPTPQSGVLACSVTSRVVQRSCTSPALGQATVCI